MRRVVVEGYVPEHCHVGIRKADWHRAGHQREALDYRLFGNRLQASEIEPAIFDMVGVDTAIATIRPMPKKRLPKADRLLAANLYHSDSGYRGPPRVGRSRCRRCIPCIELHVTV